MLYFLDTSAILNGALTEYEDNVWISPLVIKELENIKNSNKPEQIKYLARKAVRDILIDTNIICQPMDQHRVKKLLKKYKFLNDINDHRILCEAKLADKKEETYFITSDGLQYIFSQKMGLHSFFYEPKKNAIKKDEYCGWKKVHPNEQELAALYTNPTENIFQALTNEFVEIYQDDELKDILFWDGNKYTQLKYKQVKGLLGDKILPRNIEQKMLFHILQNRNIPVKVALGVYGSGKTMLMLAHACHYLQNGMFERIIYVRNNINVKDTRDIGALPGEINDKMMEFMGPLRDHLGDVVFEDYLQQEKIKCVPLNFMRGRDFSTFPQIIFVDESENLTKQQIQLLLGRIGGKSQIWFAGDLRQTDNLTFEKNSGLIAMLDRLPGNELFGFVKLTKSERGEVADLANLMDY